MENTETIFETLYEQCKDIELSLEFIVYNAEHAHTSQLGLKLLLNTIYGMCGCSYHQFYYPELAGGVTTLGKKSILEVNTFVENLGCEVIYNDTDSSYFSPPAEWFDKLDKAYYSGVMTKYEYSTQLVKYTQKYTEEITPKLNQHFINIHKADSLKLNYEEVLWKVFWAAKKKYAGRKHEVLVNHTSEILFIKGLELVRRESSPFLCKIYKELLLKILDLNNMYELIDLCEKTLLETYLRQWSNEDFLKSIVYRPHKQNPQAHTFYDRMRQRDEEYKNNGIIRKSFCPIPNERFTYIMVKIPRWKYDFRGHKTYTTVGDGMEYLWYVIEQNLEIDMNYYTGVELAGMMSRLITYHPQFYVQPTDDSLEAHKESEKLIYTKAKKYMSHLCDKLYSRSDDQGQQIKTAFKFVESQFKTNLTKITGEHHSLFTLNHNKEKILRDKDLHKSKNQSIVRIGLLREMINRNRNILIRQAIKNSRKYATYFIQCKIYGRFGTMKESEFNLKKQYAIMQENNIMYWNKKRNYANDLLQKLTEKIMNFHDQRDQFYKTYMERLSGVDYDLDCDLEDDYDYNTQFMAYNEEDLNNMLVMNIQLIALYEKIIRIDIIADTLLFSVRQGNGLLVKPSSLSIKDEVAQYSQKYA